MLNAIFAITCAALALGIVFAIGYRLGKRPTANSPVDHAAELLAAIAPASADDLYTVRDDVSNGLPDVSGVNPEGILTQRKVMIVDDESINIKLAQKYLRLAGYEHVVGVTDSTTVMDRLAEEQPDVVLLDIMMPKVSGMELLEQIRRERRWTYLPVIIVTASDNEETKVKALELGATDFLGKPVDGTELIPRVRNALIVKAHHDYLKHYAKELERRTRQLEAQIAQARTDALTGLANRRALDEEMDHHYVQCQRSGAPLSSMLLDVDHFKAFNDTHGHRAGDEALRVVAGILRGAMRELDIVARYGGEEFLVILPGTALDGARMVAERTRQDIGKTTFRYDGKNLSLTVSIGVAQLAGKEHVTQMLQRCDQALYAAKQAGRNFTYWHDGRAAHDIAYDAPSDREPQSTARAVQQAQPQSAASGDRQESVGSVPASLDNLAGESQAAFDSLGVHCDRGAFFWQVHQRIAEWKRGAGSFCLMLVHIARDETASLIDTSDDLEDTIRVTARVLSTVVREMDMIGRYDAHGLCLLLPRATLAQGAIVVQRVRQYMEANRAALSLLPVQFALRVGVAEVCEGDDPVRLFQRAEAAAADFHFSAV